MIRISSLVIFFNKQPKFPVFYVKYFNIIFLRHSREILKKTDSVFQVMIWRRLIRFFKIIRNVRSVVQEKLLTRLIGSSEDVSQEKFYLNL